MPFSWTGRLFRFAALHRIRFGTQTPMNDRKIERSYERCFAWQQVVANSIEISFHIKNLLFTVEIYKAFKTF